MILSIPLAIYAICICSTQLYANDNEDPMLVLRKEMADFIALQEKFDEQKNDIQEELSKALKQLAETGKQQAQLDTDIKECNQLITQLSSINQQLSDDNQQLITIVHDLREQSTADQKMVTLLQEQLDELIKKDQLLQEQKVMLERTITDLQEQLNQSQTKEKKLYHKKIEAKTQAAIELHRLKRTIVTLQEKVDDTSWSNAMQDHFFKLVMCYAAGALTAYVIDHHGLPRTA